MATFHFIGQLYLVIILCIDSKNVFFNMFFSRRLEARSKKFEFSQQREKLINETLPPKSCWHFGSVGVDEEKIEISFGI